MKVVLLLINLAVVAYLAVKVRRYRRSAASSGPADWRR